MPAPARPVAMSSVPVIAVPAVAVTAAVIAPVVGFASAAVPARTARMRGMLLVVVVLLAGALRAVVGVLVAAHPGPPGGCCRPSMYFSCIGSASCFQSFALAGAASGLW